VDVRQLPCAGVFYHHVGFGCLRENLTIMVDALTSQQQPTACTTKRCPTCGKTLDRAEFHKNKASGDGLHSQCKECNVLRCRSYREINKDKCALSARLRRKKKYEDDPSATIQERNKKALYRAANAEKRKEYARQFRLSNPEKCREYGRRFSLANRDKCRAASKEHYLQNKDYYISKTRKYRKQNPLLGSAIDAKRRALLVNADGYQYTRPLHIKARWAFYGNKCWMCGQPAEHTDHVIPLNAGGSHWPANLRPACAKCNCSRPKDGCDLPTRKK
jgi:hypothetical protein